MVGRIYPRTIFLQDIDQLFNCNVAVHGSFYDVLSFVKRDLSWTTAHISEIGIGHFTRSVHDASHDRDLHSFQMMRYCPDLSSGFLQIK